MTLPPGRLRPCGRLRVGAPPEKPLPKEDGVLKEEEEEEEEPIAPSAEAAAADRSRRLGGFASLSSKWRGVVEKGWYELVVAGFARALRPRTRRAAWRGIEACQWLCFEGVGENGRRSMENQVTLGQSTTNCLVCAACGSTRYSAQNLWAATIALCF